MPNNGQLGFLQNNLKMEILGRLPGELLVIADLSLSYFICG